MFSLERNRIGRIDVLLVNSQIKQMCDKDYWELMFHARVESFQN